MPSLYNKEPKLKHLEMKNKLEFHMKLCLNLPECGLLEDQSEEDKMMKRIKKTSILNGELFPKLDIQKED